LGRLPDIAGAVPNRGRLVDQGLSARPLHSRALSAPFLGNARGGAPGWCTKRVQNAPWRCRKAQRRPRTRGGGCRYTPALLTHMPRQRGQHLMATRKIGPPAATFQDLILALQQYWASQGCVLLQPYDMEMGAGTFHSATFLRSIGPEPWSAAYVQPSRRPTDGRYGENPFRLQHYYQFQVVIKPSPANIQELYIGSLRAIGFDPLEHDLRFVE